MCFRYQAAACCLSQTSRGLEGSGSTIFPPFFHYFVCLAFANLPLLFTQALQVPRSKLPSVLHAATGAARTRANAQMIMQSDFPPKWLHRSHVTFRQRCQRLPCGFHHHSGTSACMRAPAFSTISPAFFPPKSTHSLNVFPATRWSVSSPLWATYSTSSS